MKNLYIYLSVFIFSSTTLAQELKFSQRPTFIYDYNHKEALLFKNDSIVLKTKHKKEVSVFKEPFPGNLSEYLYINVGGRSVFVHEGCGPVLEFRNDSLVRLDKSYLHRNQFWGSLFAYQNEIYILGGYGLFTHKKILTKYSFENREWELVKTNDKNMPTFSNCISIVINDKLFVFGGYTNETANHNLYILNLKTKEWKVCGSKIFKKFGELQKDKCNLLIEENGFYAMDGISIYYLDFKKNLIKKYKNERIKHYYGNFIFNDSVHGIFKINEDKNYSFEFEKYPLKNHISNKNDFIVIDEIYYEDHTELYSTLSVVFILLVITIYLIIRKKYWFLSIVHQTAFLYSVKNESLFFKGKKVQLINSYDILLLEKQLEHKNNFFALSDLNELFEDKKTDETLDVLVKRREKKLNNFIKTIAAVSGMNSDEICAFKKNEADKRIREIQILPKAITFIS